MRRRTLMFATIGGSMLATSAGAAAPDLTNTVYMDLKYGQVVIELRPDLAPKNVAQVEKLINQHFYDGTPFWRVIAGFMAQGGDPTGSGTGGSKLPDLPAEFTDQAEFLRGTIGMARTSDPNSANSQFFICLAPATFLDGKYTIIGQVVKGMEYVDEIKKGTGDNGRVTDPDRIITMRMASQAKN